MKKKILSILVAILIIAAFIANHLITYASVAETPLYVKLSKTDSNGIGYGNGNPNPTVGETSNQGEYIWNISAQGAESENRKNLYCVKADYGQTWFTEQKENEQLEYNLTYDIQTDREKLLKILQDNGNDADDVIRALLDPEGSQYRQLLWIFDNAYIISKNETAEKEEYIDEYLAKAGILSYEYEGSTYYYKIKDGLKVDYPNGDPLTEADIIAVQRMAIWYFTNGANYDKTADELWLFMTTNGTDYNQLKTLSESRNAMAMDLYRYLIAGAQTGASQYKEENGYKIDGTPANVDTTGLTKKNNKYVLETVRTGANYLIGPIVINQNNDLGYDIEILVSNQNNNPLTKNTDYTYTDKNGNELEDVVSDKDLVGLSEGFYIKVPRNKIESIAIKVKISYKTTPKKLWLQGTETESEIKLNAEQPLLELIQDPHELTVDLTSKPEEFDLALRKYITGLNDKNGNPKQIPNARNLNNISLETLITGTTATYKHRKDPVVVEDGDEVTYQIRIYNEGNKSGYATEIIDQLPAGLIRSTNTASTVVSKDKAGNAKNTYKVSYSTTTNRITLNIVNTDEKPAQNIQPYTVANGLDYEIIEIKCKVAQEPDTKKQITLTNVAWINEAYNSDDSKPITTTIGDDRDSEPGTLPKLEDAVVNKSNTENYKGNTANPADLSNSDYFYEGQQDDDDFEKLVIMPVDKKFDLELVKFIAAVSKDAKIDDGEYLTDTKNAGGKYDRAPKISIVKEQDSENRRIHCDWSPSNKNPLTVEPGDYVLYTIRVYNAGEQDGYAALIKDHLPVGLEHVEPTDETAEYYGIWNVDSFENENGDEYQVVSTNYLAKGQGAELDAKKGDDNYTANLLKALDVDGKVTDDTTRNPDYRDVQVLCRVKENTKADKVLVNYAQISEDSDKDGNIKDEDGNDMIVDDDSTPDNLPKDGPHEDDEDLEKIKVRKTGQYDLILVKEDENGEQLNSTATFEVTTNGVTETKNVTGKLTIAQNVPVDGNHLTDDVYVIKETKAPDDYCQFDGTITITVTKNLKADGTGYEKHMTYVVTDPKENDITSNKDANVYVNTNGNIYVEVKNYEEPKEFDLALRKFITKVQEKDVISRVPQPKIENGKITYEHSKEPLIVHAKDTVIYTIRVYNEGELSGFASEVTDDIPEYLEYLPEDLTNVEYMWKMYDKNGNETKNVAEAVKVKTTYLSKENGEDKLIKAFDGKTLDFKDIKIAFKVKDPNSNTYIITNHAQISDHTDKNGDKIQDIDSTPDKWNEGEDDQDIENVKVEYFDLALLKFVSKVIVIEDGKEKITETGYNGHEDPEPVVKVELHKKKLSKVTVKFGYGITITNEGDIPGYATEITDYIPQGLKFDPNDNPEWMDEGNNVISTKQLENTLLQPGESKTVEVILTWINGKDNLALKTNTAEISEDKNEYDVPDKDSTPDNKKDGEDDIDIAKVILAVSTGGAKTYFALTLGLLAVIATGIVLIKKFVI